MIAAVVVLSIFAALWGSAGIMLSHAAQWEMAIPIAISLVLGAVALQRVRRLPSRSPEEGRRIGRLIGIWSGVEVAAIIVAVNLLQYFNRTDLSMAAVCACVGLHFVPLARYIPAPIYSLTAAGLIAIAAAGLAVPSVMTQPLVSYGAALVLWATIIAIAANWRPTGAPAASPDFPR